MKDDSDKQLQAEIDHLEAERERVVRQLLAKRLQMEGARPAAAVGG